MKRYIFRILTIIGLIILNLNAQSHISSKSIGNDIMNLSDQIDRMHTRSIRYRKLAESFRDIARFEYNLIKSVVDVKANCNNIKLKYDAMNVGSITKNYQNNSLKKCYKMQIKTITNFERIDRKFKILEGKMKVLENLHNSEILVYDNLKKLLAIQKKMLQAEKIQLRIGIDTLNNDMRDYQ